MALEVEASRLHILFHSRFEKDEVRVGNFDGKKSSPKILVTKLSGLEQILSQRSGLGSMCDTIFVGWDEICFA